MLVRAQRAYTRLAILVLPQSKCLREVRDALGGLGEDELDDPVAICRVELREALDLSGELARGRLISIAVGSLRIVDGGQALDSRSRSRSAA
jgi:hypothetical protein